MTVSLQNQIANNPVINEILSIDENQRIRIIDQGKALNILAQFDVNSIEYRVIQIAMQLSNLQEQNDLKERINLGELEIVRLLEENRRISDELTAREMREDSDQFRSAERMDGIKDILSTPLGVALPPMLIILPIMGLCKIFVPGSDAMRKRESELGLYRVFHPEASLTESYTYVKKHPLAYDRSEFSDYIDVFRGEYPNGTYAEFVQYITERLPPPTRTEIEYTDRGPTSFQLVTKCDCPDCTEN